VCVCVCVCVPHLCFYLRLIRWLTSISLLTTETLQVAVAPTRRSRDGSLNRAGADVCKISVLCCVRRASGKPHRLHLQSRCQLRVVFISNITAPAVADGGGFHSTHRIVLVLFHLLFLPYFFRFVSILILYAAFIVYSPLFLHCFFHHNIPVCRCAPSFLL